MKIFKLTTKLKNFSPGAASSQQSQESKNFVELHLVISAKT